MAIATVVTTDSPACEDILLVPSKEVAQEEFGTIELESLVQDMIETEAFAQGVGIAAPQIGVNKRVIVVGFEEGKERYAGKAAIPIIAIVNPKLEPVGDEMEKGEEGCLSVPGVRALVPRYKKVRCQGVAVDGSPIDIVASDFYARILQHECDHLDGRLFTSRVESDADYLKR